MTHCLQDRLLAWWLTLLLALGCTMVKAEKASDGYTMLYQTNFKGISPFIYPSK